MLNLTKHLNLQYVLEKYSPHIVDIQHICIVQMFLSPNYPHIVEIFPFSYFPITYLLKKNCFCRLLKIIILDNYIFLY